MALPALSNVQIDGNASGSVQRLDLTFSSAYTGNAWTFFEMPQQTALATTNATNGSATTANLATDTIIYRADGGIWDDTVQAWIPVDKTNVNMTPRK